MIDPTKTAERQYDAIAKIIEEHGFVKERIVDALAQRLALEVFAHLNAELDEPPTTSPVPLPVALDVLVQRMKEDAEEYENRMRRRAFADAINNRVFSEHYTPIPAKETDQ